MRKAILNIVSILVWWLFTTLFIVFAIKWGNENTIDYFKLAVIFGIFALLVDRKGE